MACSICSATTTSARRPRRGGCSDASGRSRACSAARRRAGRTVATVSLSRNGGPAVAVARHPRRAARAGLAVASGLVLAAAFPPVDLEFLGWVGLVPLLLACRGLGPRAAFAIGFLGGGAFYLPLPYWVAQTISAYSATPLAPAVPVRSLIVRVLPC